MTKIYIYTSYYYYSTKWSEDPNLLISLMVEAAHGWGLTSVDLLSASASLYGTMVASEDAGRPRGL